MSPARREATHRAAGSLHAFAVGLTLLTLLTSATLGCGPNGAEVSATNANEWVAEVRRAHSLADEAEVSDRPLAARAALSPVAAQEAPHDVAPLLARAVRQDLYFRLATVAAAADDHEGARDAASAGLSLGEGPDVLTANLFIARAEAYEALGDGARASSDYLSALRINEALLDAVLGQGEGAP